MVTETHDPGEARDILDTIIAVDRADIPATTQRRILATQDRQPQPRCPIPDWFDRLRNDTLDQLDQARDDYNRNCQQAVELEQHVASVEQQAGAARLHAQPFNAAIDTAEAALAAAIACRQALHQQLATAKRRDRHILRPVLAIAERDIPTATLKRDRAIDAAQPSRTVTANTVERLHQVRDQQRRHQLFGRWLANPETIDILQHRVDALDTWRHWANGHHLTDTQIKQMNTGLYVANDSTTEHFALRRALLNHPPTAAIVRRAEAVTIERPSVPELSID